MSEVVGGYHTGGQPEKKEQDTALPNELETKPWRCGNGHQLGYVIVGDPTLRLYAEAKDPNKYYVGVDIIAKITGSAEIQCTICGEKRVWHHATERTEQFIEKITKRRTES